EVPKVARKIPGSNIFTTNTNGGVVAPIHDLPRSPVMFTSTINFNVAGRDDVKPSVSGQMPRKRELARLMREHFDEFRESLARQAQADASTQDKSFVTPSVSSSATNTSGSAAASTGRGVQIGEVVTKSERRAGEDPSGVKSGVLRIEAHPIPVTFTSLPGFPPFSRIPTSIAGVEGAVSGGQPGVGIFAPGVESTVVGGSEGPLITRVPGLGGGTRGSSRVGTPGSLTNGVRNLMKLLESRLIGGIREATTVTGSPTTATLAPIQNFDPSIVVNFLTLVALSQHHRRGGAGSSSPGQRNAASAGAPTISLPPPAAQSEFGPFSTGNDPSAGVDPSSIVLPPMLRQTLYSYLLPRLASLTAL
ncbi:hypothetical protein OTU49_008317, partial [Cherax quadricarinatus]